MGLSPSVLAPLLTSGEPSYLIGWVLLQVMGSLAGGGESGSLFTSELESNRTLTSAEEGEAEAAAATPKKPVSILHRNARVIRWIHDSAPRTPAQ